MFKLCEIKGDQITEAAIRFIKKDDCRGITPKFRESNKLWLCVHVHFVFCARGHLCIRVRVCGQETGLLSVTAGEADVVFQDTPRAPAINDDNLNFDTLVFAEAAKLDELRKSPI